VENSKKVGPLSDFQMSAACIIREELASIPSSVRVRAVYRWPSAGLSR
jgi:hypothetical protein